MVPTPAAAPGAKGHRPAAGTQDCKHLLYVFAVVNPATAAVHANLADGPKDAERRTGQSETRRMRAAFAAHLRHAGRISPRAKCPRVVPLIDNALRHRGGPIDEALRDNPHLEFELLPAYSPQLYPIERLWKVLRRRATHNRLFDTLADLRRSVRNSLRY